MSFDLGRDDSKAYWISYPPSPDEWYFIKPLTPAIIEHCQKMTTRMIRGGIGPEAEKRDEKRYMELLYDHLLEDWDGVTAGGEKVPCTLDNKNKLRAMSGERINWIITTAIAFANDDEVRQEAEKQSFRPISEDSARSPMAEVPRVLGIERSEHGSGVSV